ncbi:MAG: hypothetical protein GY717_05810 [Rhodobacteraceae bacterium]|nr:hypothetical protein [Paracoccaceae bacterium]
MAIAERGPLFGTLDQMAVGGVGNGLGLHCGVHRDTRSSCRWLTAPVLIAIASVSARTSSISSGPIRLLCTGLTKANVDAGIFNLWLEQLLIPKLPPKAVIVMDRATFHRRSDTKTLIKASGHTLEYLPA